MALEMRRSGGIMGRINRRHPWLKIVVIIIVIEVLLVLWIVEPMLKNGNVRLEIPLGEQIQEIDEGAGGSENAVENEV